MKSIWRPVSEKPDLKISKRIVVRTHGFLGFDQHVIDERTLEHWEQLTLGSLGWCYYEDIEKAMLPDENTEEIEVCERPKPGAIIMAKTCYTQRNGQKVFEFSRGKFLENPDRFFNDETGEEIAWRYIWFWVPYRGGDL